MSFHNIPQLVLFMKIMNYENLLISMCEIITCNLITDLIAEDIDNE